MGLTCFVETFVQDSTFVLRMNSSAKNSPQRLAPNCYKNKGNKAVDTPQYFHPFYQKNAAVTAELDGGIFF